MLSEIHSPDNIFRNAAGDSKNKVEIREFVVSIAKSDMRKD